MTAFFQKHKITQHRWYLCFFVFTVSFLISLFLLLGGIDPDFFSFLYVGQGVLEGKNMYRDFADNKGPVLYLFFTILRFVFGDHFGLMFIISSTILDASAVLLIYFIARRIWGMGAHSWIFTSLLLFFSTAWYKSFSISIFPGGGIYSEMLALPLLFASIALISQKKYYASGFLFSLSILTRLTMAFFIFYIIALLWKRANKKEMIRFCIGVFLPLLIACGWFFSQGTFWNFFDNMILWNIQYGHMIWQEKVQSIIASLLYAPIIHLSVLLILSGMIVFIFTSKKTRPWEGFALYTSSFFSIFFAGIFYVHHATQLALIFFFSLKNCCTFSITRLVCVVFIIFSLFLLPLHYGAYLLRGGPHAILSLQHQHPDIKEIKEAQYLQMITYFPAYYFFYNKRSPDSFFLPAFLNKTLNPAIEKNIKKHASLDPLLIRNTAFVAVKWRFQDTQVAKNYISSFQKSFHLIEKAHYTDGNVDITVYTSSEK